MPDANISAHHSCSPLSVGAGENKIKLKEGKNSAKFNYTPSCYTLKLTLKNMTRLLLKLCELFNKWTSKQKRTNHVLCLSCLIGEHNKLQFHYFSHILRWFKQGRTSKNCYSHFYKALTCTLWHPAVMLLICITSSFQFLFIFINFTKPIK